MNIVVATDDNFVQHCAVTLLSVMEHNSQVSVFVLTEGLTTDNEKILRTIVEQRGGDFHLCLVPSDTVRYFPMSKMASAHIGIATYYRLFVCSLLPDHLERAIYMDCDMVVRGSLDPLWNTDLRGKALGAVYQDVMWSDHNCCWERLWIPRECGYFNAGLLLLNLEFLREFRFQEKAIQFINDHFNHIISHDQDVLNSLLHDYASPLSCRWNFMSLFLSKRLKDEFFPEGCRYASERKEEGFEPVIVHFVSKPKPWHYGCTNPYTHEYFAYLQQTPWASFKPSFHWKQYLQMVIIPSLKCFFKKLDILELTEMRHHWLVRSQYRKSSRA